MASKRKQILEAINQESKLPPVPKTIIRLRELIDDPDAGIIEVEQVIKSDPVLAGRLIKLANSVFASGSSIMVSSLTRALARLGLKMAMDVAYSLEIPKMFSQTTGINQTEFWQHSLGCAILTSKLAKMEGLDREEQANAYLGGLMRKIGILIFCHVIPKEYGHFLAKVQELIDSDREKFKNCNGLKFDIMQKKIFGIDHVELGSKYVEKWWPVDQKVIDHIKAKPLPMSRNLVDMSELILMAEGLQNGVFESKLALPPEYVQMKFQLSTEYYEEVSEVLSDSLRALG